MVLAVAVAYWTVLQERGEAMEAHRAATDAFLAAGGDPEAAARDHPDWLYQSARERIAREERWWRDRGV